MSSVRMTSTSEEELVEQEEDNTSAAEGKRESGALGECFEELAEEVVCNKSAECCEYDGELRTICLAYRSRMGNGEERHTLRKSWW